MGLQIKHNRAEHTHENEQFRRLARSLRQLFEEQKWDGLLIGNPYDERYFRFRPDAILLYNHGLIIIDLKAYAGNLRLPADKTEFESKAWYIESDTDKQRIQIKAGNRFINPFKQLDSYRKAFKEIVRDESGLKGEVNEHKTLALNIFSGPLRMENDVPREIPYYRITQESDLGTVLYDYASENSYSEEIASTLCAIFHAEDWQENIAMPEPERVVERHIDIDPDVEGAISEFLKTKESGVLILESMDSRDRDDWVKYILSQLQRFELPQMEEPWIHSGRVGRTISTRMGGELKSLFKAIYGGRPESLSSADEPEAEEKGYAEALQKFIPLRSDEPLDESAVIVLHEAHLVTTSKLQFELVRFGTGRLLKDLLTFLHLSETKRKLICIGDPYSLTYGKHTESALDVSTIATWYSGKIVRFRKPPGAYQAVGRFGLRLNIAHSIEKNRFNNLSFPWEPGDLSEITESEMRNHLIAWFSMPMDSEPTKAVMVYTNEHANRVNRWIKENALKNGEDLSASDLLILNNSISISAETELRESTRLQNGMYVLVNSVGGITTKTVSIKYKERKKDITLAFRKVKVSCLSVPGRPQVELYILDNYFRSESGLSKEEQIAFRVLVDKIVAAQMQKEPFESSQEYKDMLQDDKYKEAVEEAADAKRRHDSGEKDKKTELAAKERKVRKIKRAYERSYRNRLRSIIISNDPFANAAHVRYGWALTVHKCLGSSFSEAIIDANQGPGRGITSEAYFRWLYSGISTTMDKLLVVNPQFVHPLMNTGFEDSSTTSTNHEPTQKKLLAFPGYQIDNKFVEIIPQQLKPNVAGAICELSKELEHYGFLLESVNIKGEYLTKASYSVPSSPEKRLVIAMNNKGQKDDWSVSSIRVEQCPSGHEGAVNQEIEKLFAIETRPLSSDSLALPDDFRFPIYQNWVNVLSSVGYHLALIASHNNQDVFLLSSENNESARFRVWYNNDGLFTKIEVFQNSSSELRKNLKDWLLNGNKA